MADRPKPSDKWPEDESALDRILRAVEPFADEYVHDHARAELEELREKVEHLKVARDVCTRIHGTADRQPPVHMGEW
jgi:hypothetical protein